MTKMIGNGALIFFIGLMSAVETGRGQRRSA
jgi:hypothetical protein